MGIKFNYSDNKGISISSAYARINNIIINNGSNSIISFDIYVSKTIRDENIGLRLLTKSIEIPSDLQSDIISSPFVNGYEYAMGLDFFDGAEMI